jgi:hypothetical protein
MKPGDGRSERAAGRKTNDAAYAQLVATMRERAAEMMRQNEQARAEGSKAVEGRLMSAHAKEAADKNAVFGRSAPTARDPLGRHDGVRSRTTPATRS